MDSDVVCIGEILWDLFPDGQRTLGGALANVTYHLNHFGVAAQLVSKVGEDELGDCALVELRRRGLSTAGILVDPILPTGSASVQFNSLHEISYTFNTPAAWDAIEASPLHPKFAIVFGTLAQRDERTRRTIHTCAKKTPKRIYDLNLRPPFTPLTAVLESLNLATLVKMNEAEAALLSQELQIPGDPRGFAIAIRKRFGPEVVCITRGANGACLTSPDGFIEVEGRAIRAGDSVGAGDAFLAGLVEGFLSRTPWPHTLMRANQMGSWVASERGAMPPYSSAPAALNS